MPCPECDEKIKAKLYKPVMTSPEKVALMQWLKGQSDVEMNNLTLYVDGENVTIESNLTTTTVVLDHSDFADLLLEVLKRVSS